MSSTLSVAHNLTALNTQKNLYGTNRNLAGNISRLSSGYKINQGQDGPADLVISELLRSQIGGINRATRNSTEAMNVLSIAEGALNEMNEILNKMKQLALHAANGTTSTDQIRADQAEIDSGIATINRIANTTRYGDSQLLNGSLGITYNNKVVQGNSLIDARHTRIDQIFQTKDTKIEVGYTGYNAVKNEAVMLNQARSAYFEATGDNRNQIVMAGDQRYATTAAATYISGNASGYANQVRANERQYESGDSHNTFTEYNFVNASGNTDATGNIYFKVVMEDEELGGAGTREAYIYAYKNSGRSGENEVVAKALIETGVAATVTEKTYSGDASAAGLNLPQLYFKEVNNSGMRGAIRIDNNTTISQATIDKISYRVTDPDFDSKTGSVLKDQSVIITGNVGSGSFGISEGFDIATLVASINNQAASTGVGAAIILGQNALTHSDNHNTAIVTADATTLTTVAVAGSMSTGASVSGVIKGVNSNSLGAVYVRSQVSLNSVGAATTTLSLYNNSLGSGTALASITFFESTGNTGVNTAQRVVSANNASWTSYGLAAAATSRVLEFVTEDGLKVNINVASLATTSTTGNGVAITNYGFADNWNFVDKNGNDTLLAGFNTDNNGKLYAEVVYSGTASDGSTINLYKDANRTELVATTGLINRVTVSLGLAASVGGRYEFTEVNGSGLNGSVELIAGNAPALSNQFEITTNRIESVAKTEVNNKDADNITAVSLSGVKIGDLKDLTRNTDASGYMYVATESRLNAAGTANEYRMVFYRDANMQQKVGETEYFLAGATGVEIKAMNNSGLGGTVDFSATIDTSAVMKIRPEVGMRLYSTEYGSTQSITVQNSEGNLFDYYNAADSNWVDAKVGETTRVYGQDATITVNGTSIRTNGLTATVANSVITAQFELNAGILASYFNAGGDGTAFGTTIAQVGYQSGTASARAGQMENKNNLFVNAGSNNRQELYNFQGGLTLQLGDQANVQDRTVVSVASMAAANQGVKTFTDDFYGDGNYTTKTLTLEDIQSGQLASLDVDPQKAIAIIEQAIMDVSNARARLGATQSNLLQTNINNLQVAFENITKTESYIRDTDYATETTEFAKNQIMLQAGTSMLAQANMMNQVVLTLLG